MIYDTILQKWVAIDSTRVNQIKQVAFVEIPTETKLYAINTSDELYQMFKGTKTEVSWVRTKAYTWHDTQALTQTQTHYEHKGSFLKVMFAEGSVDGTVTLFEHVDGEESLTNRETKALKVTVGGIVYPVAGPNIPHSQQRVNEVTFSLTQGLTGRKISYIIVWTNDCQLFNYELVTDDHSAQVAQKQKDETYNAISNQSSSV
jgi:hypothetical protein